MSDDDSSKSSQDDVGEQVRIAFRLSSDCQDRSLAVSTLPMAVPADISRKGLSLIVNHLLNRKISSDDEEVDVDQNHEDEEDRREDAIPFDFMIQKNKLLRSGLEREARRVGLSLEQVIEITYFPMSQKPQEVFKEKLPDWISTLSYVDGTLCSGCYDGSVSLFQVDYSETEAFLKRKVNIVLPSRGPLLAMASCKLDRQNSRVLLATGSMDHSLYLDEVNNETFDVERLAMSTAHTASIGCLEFCNSNKILLASGDWDGSLCIFDASSTEANQQQIQKKSRSDVSSSFSSAIDTNTRLLTPQISLQAHTSKISGVSWGNHNKKDATDSLRIVTGSWDHTLKLWDVERQDCLLTLNGSRVVTSLDTSYHSENVVATGHPDCRIRLWDTRADGEGIAKVADTTLSPSHKAWISQVKWSESIAYELSSISHDGNIKIWDIRSSLPLHTVQTGNAKGLCLEYGGNEFLFAGGTSGIVHQYRCSKLESPVRQ